LLSEIDCANYLPLLGLPAGIRCCMMYNLSFTMPSQQRPTRKVMAKVTVPPVGFLGAGKMATALARGWIDAGLVSPRQIVASDPMAAAGERFAQEPGAAILADNIEVVKQSHVLVLAVKPQDVAAVLTEIAPLVDNRQHLLISIAAGVSLKQI